MNKFVITRYIETSICTEIVYADFDRHSHGTIIPKYIYIKEYSYVTLAEDYKRNSNNSLDLVTQNNVSIQEYNNVDLSQC